jgi:hypothetical protein
MFPLEAEVLCTKGDDDDSTTTNYLTTTTRRRGHDAGYETDETEETNRLHHITFVILSVWCVMVLLVIGFVTCYLLPFVRHRASGRSRRMPHAGDDAAAAAAKLDRRDS